MTKRKNINLQLLLKNNFEAIPNLAPKDDFKNPSEKVLKSNLSIIASSLTSDKMIPETMSEYFYLAYKIIIIK